MRTRFERNVADLRLLLGQRGVVCSAQILGRSLIVVICFSLISSCTFYSYEVLEKEVRNTKSGRISFAIYVDPNVLKGPDEFAKYKTDDSKDYYELSVYFLDTVFANRSIRLVADSVFIVLQEPFLISRFNMPDMETRKASEEWFIDIKPFPLPKKYERDFDVKFKLRIYDDDSGELLEVLSLSVHCKWTRHFYTIFNSPYG